MDAPTYMYFCRPDSLFHDVPLFDDGRFAQTDAPAPEGWTLSAGLEWVTVLPPRPLPRQGWKVHVSATGADAERTLAACYDFCVEAGIGFKFLRSAECLMARSSKYADRTGSGKFVTIYPVDDAELEAVVHELGARLEGAEGPYILSDVRWRGGPLYLRYGAFQSFHVRTGSGELKHAIEAPDGTLVPDVRGPVFRPPEWVTLPPVVAEAVADRAGSRLSDFPFRPTAALHFSNGGGVYRGTDADGAPVLIKEARPHAGLDSSGTDAVARLERERWAYEQLAGLPETPELLDHRRGHEHYFLVREEVVGEDLQQLVFTRNPLLRADPEPADFAAYAAWALDLVDRIEAGLAGIHARGVVYGDLHPGNVLVTADGSVRFIDMESSRPADEDSGQFMAAPGYAAPPGHRGTAIDRFALGILRLAVFVPMPSLLNWDDGKMGEFLDLVHRHFPVPADFEERFWADLALDPTRQSAPDLARPIRPSGWPAAGRAEDWRAVEDRLAAGILAAATPDRADRLYPGDVAQHLRPGAGLGLSHGAAGAHWALRATGHAVPDEHRAWLADAVAREPWQDPGLANGLAGVALALEDEELLTRAVALLGDSDAPRLADGLAGVGLAALHLAASADPAARARQLDLAAELADRLLRAELAWTAGEWGTGLLGGPAGAAALLLGLFEATGHADHLHHAARLLRVEVPQPSRPGRTEPDRLGAHQALFARGGGGRALVAHRVLRHLADPELSELRDTGLAATEVGFLVEGGLFAGRAGVLLVRHGLTDGAPDPVVQRHLRDLRLHVVGHHDDLYALAPIALRLSTDLATGNAGLLVAVHAATTATAIALPYLPPTAAPARTLQGAAR